MGVVGSIDKKILSEDMPLYVACQIAECSVCEGSGYKEWGYVAELGLPAKEGVKCDRCKGTGYILDLGTAISVRVSTIVEVEAQE